MVEISERESLSLALRKARRILAMLEEQAAGYTTLTIPASLRLELEDQKQEVIHLETLFGLARSNTGTLAIVPVTRSKSIWKLFLVGIIPASLIAVIITIIILNQSTVTVTGSMVTPVSVTTSELQFTAQPTATPISVSTVTPVPPPTFTPFPGTKVPEPSLYSGAVLESKLKAVNIMVTFDTDPTLLTLKRSYIKNDQDWVTVANNYLNLLGNKKLKKPLDLDTFYFFYREMVTGNGTSIPLLSQLNDTAKLKQSLLVRWNEHYADNQYSSFEELFVS